MWSIFLMYIIYCNIDRFHWTLTLTLVYILEMQYWRCWDYTPFLGSCPFLSHVLNILINEDWVETLRRLSLSDSYFWSNYLTLLFGHKLKINISYNHCIQAWDELIVRNFSVGASSEKGNQFSVSLIKVRALTQLVSWFSIQGVLSQKFFFAKLIKKVS